MYVFVRGTDFASFYDLLIILFFNGSDSVLLMSPDDEPKNRPVKLSSDQYIFQFVIRYIYKMNIRN